MPVIDCSTGEVREHLPEELPEAAPLADRRSSRLQELADLRWRMCQTFAHDGVANASADSAMPAVTAYVVASQFLAPDATVTWKLGQGEFRTWTVGDVVTYGMAIRTHVQACFNNEAALSAAILSSEAPEEVDLTAGWPG